MAYGMEVLLGFKSNQFLGLRELIGKEINKALIDEGGNIYDIVDEVVLNEINEKLQRAHIKSFEEIGISDVVVEDNKFIAKTFLGNRKLSRFNLELFYDPSEIDYSYEDDAIIGISLSSRYYPTFIDWQSKSGSLSTIDLEHIYPLIEIAKRNITEEFPIFEKSNIYIKMMHY